jgi:hypothetical protein
MKKYQPKIASCVKIAIDLFKDNNEEDGSQRVFYIFTNGLDEELALHEKLKKDF